jgi:predicted AAA+ superfamily ATPase
LKNVNFFDLIKELYKAYKIDTFFLDELQFLENWQQILKNIYDFLDVKVVFSGSSMLKITS